MSVPPLPPSPQGFPFPQNLWENLTHFFSAAESNWNFQLNSRCGADCAGEFGLIKHPGGPSSHRTPPALACTIVRVPLLQLRVLQLDFSLESWREPMHVVFTCVERAGWRLGLSRQAGAQSASGAGSGGHDREGTKS